MEPGSAKRRKLAHSDQNGASKALATVAATGPSRSRAFILEAEELLNEIKVDYATALEGVDGLLHQIKGSIEAIEPRDPILVRADLSPT